MGHQSCSPDSSSTSTCPGRSARPSDCCKMRCSFDNRAQRLFRNAKAPLQQLELRPDVQCTSSKSMFFTAAHLFSSSFTSTLTSLCFDTLGLRFLYHLLEGWWVRCKKGGTCGSGAASPGGCPAVGAAAGRERHIQRVLPLSSNVGCCLAGSRRCRWRGQSRRLGCRCCLCSLKKFMSRHTVLAAVCQFTSAGVLCMQVVHQSTVVIQL